MSFSQSEIKISNFCPKTIQNPDELSSVKCEKPQQNNIFAVEMTNDD